MKKFFVLIPSILVLAAIIYGCSLFNIGGSHELPVFMAWDTEDHIGSGKTDNEISAYLQNLKDHNINGIFLAASNDFYKRIAPLSENIGMEIHAWRWAMNQPDKELMEQHPDWYAVSRNNESCIDKPPYVSYYRWFCPNEPDAVEYLVEMYKELAGIKGIAGIHLDYIRYCDIFLPAGLRSKYNLVQDNEMPEYDFCYCSRCRKDFENKYGYDPMHITDSAYIDLWTKRRLDAVVRIVNRIADEVKSTGDIHVTAAVFPTPKMAAEMVRQDWSRFEIDAVLPMLYNEFYNENVDWIGKCVKEGIKTMEYKKDIYAGLMVSHISEAAEFTDAINTALGNGAKGISFFTAAGLKDEHLKIIKNYKRDLN